MGSDGSVLFARREHGLVIGAAAVPEHRSVRGRKRGKRATSVLLRRLRTAVPRVSPRAFEPAVRAHRATERLGRNLSRRRGHGGGGEGEEQGGDDERGEEEDDGDATTGSVSRPPLRRGVIR